MSVLKSMFNPGLLAAAALGASQSATACGSEAMCELIGNKLASIGIEECDNRQLEASGHYSVQGKPLLHHEYPPLPNTQPQARVLLIGGIHGDEYSSVSVVFKWMRTLDQHHSGLFHWRVIPLANPDGLLRRRSRRMNANGVDLNRNFPTPDWDAKSRQYWVERTKRDPRRYPGPAAMSEPEIHWLVEEIERFRPHVILSVHAPHGLVDFDGPPEAPGKVGKLNLHLLGTYPGSLGNYGGIHEGIPVVTIELPYAGIMPGRAEIRDMWHDIVRWLTENAPNERLQAKRHSEKEAQGPMGEARLRPEP